MAVIIFDSFDLDIGHAVGTDIWKHLHFIFVYVTALVFAYFLFLGFLGC